MRKIFLLLFLSMLSWNTYAQSYPQLWKNVDSLMQIKNYRESGAMILKIRKKAIAENNSPENIRTIIAEHNALTINQENTDAFNTLNKHFQNHLQQATGVEKSIIANLYAQFLLSNINLQKVDANNYYSLPIESRVQLVDSLFTLSLDNKEKLTKEPLDKWGTLLTDRQQVLIMPTLYHLLALNYLDFLDVAPSNKKRIVALTKEIQQFNTQNNYNDAAAFLSYRPYIAANEYSKHKSDSLFSKLATIQSPFNAHIYYLIARQKYPKEALQLLKTAKEKYPTSPWITNVDILYELLSLSNLEIQAPSFVPHKEYAPIKISHKNSDKLYIRVYDISSKAKVLNNVTPKYDTRKHQVTIDAPLVYEEVVTLKQFDDPYTHTSIYKINPLPYGQYQILASNNSDFKDDGVYKKTISSSFYVSDMFISAYEKDNKEDDTLYKIQLINRKSGKPYANKPIPLYYPEGIGSVLKPLKKHKTNAAGEFTFKNDFSNYELDDIILYLKEENQWINLEEVTNIPELIKEEIEKHETNDEQSIILTDRAIYRPGQPVHFKAVLHSNNFQIGKIIPNQEVIIRLKDTNDQEIKSQTLTTNSFGSINGTFDLPVKVLNGRFRLELFYNNNSIKIHSFQVEEYKRPTFKVSFEPNKNTYGKTDTAVFIGKVESLTGVPLPNSEVKYTLNIDSYSPSKSIKIDSIIHSNALGEFSIAVPLMDRAYANLSDFYISIDAEVKSPAEEIQKAHTSYSYSDQPAVLAVSTQAMQKEFAWKTVNIATTNTNGFPLPFSGVINIYKYENRNLPLGNDAFSFNAEYQLIDSLEYQKLFPNYYDIAVHRPERKKTLIARYPFDTNISSTLNIDSTLFAYGEYLLEGIAVLNKKDTLTSNQQVKVYNIKNRKYNDNTFLSYAFNKNEYFEKDTVRITFYSDVKDVQNLFLYRIEGTDIHQALVLPFHGNKAVYEFIADAASKFPKTSFEALLVKDNKIKRAPIYIPYTRKIKKDLTITTKTFRDKITPGQTEKWSFTVAQNETPAEVLASMYDSAIDQFSSNNFNSNFYLSYPYYSSHRLDHLTTEFNENAFWKSFAKQPLKSFRPIVFPQFKNYGLWSNYIYPYHRLIIKKDGNNQLEEVIIRGFSTQKKMNLTESVSTLDEVVVSGYAAGIAINDESMNLYDELKDPVLSQEIENLKQKQEKLNAVSARTNLQETAFFYPELYTDKEGNVTFEFETPEALTKWKVLLFAHTKDLQAGNATFYTHTQKQLMVQPNLPRFMRAGDQIVIKSLITNLSEEKVSGTARLQLIDPATNQVLENILISDTENKDFTIGPKNNNTVSWTISAPEGYPTVYVKITAATDEFSDGEQHELAIIPNDILISDTQKIFLNKDQQTEFSIASTGKNNLQAQVLLQSNSILEILSALDYLKNYPYDCAEQVASKWFGVKTVQYIQNHYPVLANYFSTLDTTNISSSLREKASTNELSLTEMPWLRSIINEEERLKQLATLFNRTTIDVDLQQLENRLLKLQKKDGSFVWFDGGSSNLNISIRILEIFGKIQQLDSTLLSKNNKAMLLKLKTYLDQDNLFDINSPYQQVVDYAYARQYWKEDITRNKVNKAWILKTLGHAPFATAKQPAGLAAKSWTVAQQYGLQKEANAIFNRLDQEYIIDSISGIYWKSNDAHYNTISLHAYLLEAYKNSNPSFVQGMADWLYYNKSNSNWRTTWMSVDAIYALLLTNNPADFVIDNKVKVNINHKETVLKQAAIGLSAQHFTAEDLQTDQILSIENNTNNKVYGSIVHQYFVPLEEVKESAKDIAVTKHILVFRNNEWISTNTLKSGENVKIRLEVIANKNLNFVHLKDNRAAGFEPEYRPSGYQFRNGGYYFTNKDASTNYFIDYLPQGTHIFEYEVKTNTIGLFNSGISTVECMYDPSVHARSGNLKIKIIE